MSIGRRIHVGVDARCLNTSHLRGMGKYLLGVLTHAKDSEGLHWTLFGDRPDEPFHSPSNVQSHIDLFDIRGFRFHLWEQIGLPSRARRANVHVLHCAGTTLPLWQPLSTIVTVHDTLPWRESYQTRYERWYHETIIPAAFKRCMAIITISKQSQKDILSLWPMLEPKLHVIPHGVGDNYLNNAEAHLSDHLLGIIRERPYVLYVGGDVERKRFSWALRAFEGLGNVRLKLVVCGFSIQGAKSVNEQLSPQLRERVIFLPFVAEDSMPSLYQNAVAVLYPTLYEGFGFPVVEAQAVGAPVLFSAVGSLQELIGPSAEVVPTHDISAWIATLRRLLEQRQGAPVPNRAARAWARRFSWSISAQRHVELYWGAVVSNRVR